MAIEESQVSGAAARVIQEAAAGLARRIDTEVVGIMSFRRAWIRDLGRLARQHLHDDDWITSAYAVQIIRQLRGQLPIG